ncbi:MAG: hypothetical protein K2M30_04605 [Desulfovibrionaceae bacterium]|nr:hypothetical protein [Desulfovibrionaceae bacterium]
MCGTPERNLASTLSKMMSTSVGLFGDYDRVSASNQELLRQDELMKEAAAEAKEARKEQAIHNRGSLNAKSAGGGIDLNSGTMRRLHHIEEVNKNKDIAKIDKELMEGLRRNAAQRSANSSSMRQSIFGSASSSLFNLGSAIGGLFR